MFLVFSRKTFFPILFPEKVLQFPDKMYFQKNFYDFSSRPDLEIICFYEKVYVFGTKTFFA